jgi:dUTP pyrophosphatase
MKIKLDNKNCMPKRGREGDAGLDLRSKKEVLIRRDGYETIFTGVRVEIPKNHFGLIVPRSGLGSRGFILRNTVGIIDESYRGEILLMATNKGQDAIVIKQYERVAQLIIIPYLQVDLEVVDSLEDTERGSLGFGSSGSH